MKCTEDPASAECKQETTKKKTSTFKVKAQIIFPPEVSALIPAPIMGANNSPLEPCPRFPKRSPSSKLRICTEVAAFKKEESSGASYIHGRRLH
jgi:hypothetical protein